MWLAVDGMRLASNYYVPRVDFIPCSLHSFHMRVCSKKPDNGRGTASPTSRPCWSAWATSRSSSATSAWSRCSASASPSSTPGPPSPPPSTSPCPPAAPAPSLWGLMVGGVCNLCLAASLAEFLSAYPTAGGQYYWAAVISWEGLSRAISYVAGWINVSGWVALSAAGGLLASTFILNIVSLLHVDYEPQPWHQFLIYIASTVIAFFINAFCTRLLPLFTKAASLWSIAGIVVISITVLACASPKYQSADFVYGTFINEGAFSLTGFDAVAHMIEEIPDPQRHGPRIMLYCIGIGMFTGFIFISCLLFCVNNVDDVIKAPYGPLLQTFMDATKSPAGSTCLLMFPLICVVFGQTMIMCTSSRMSYAFARVGGMPFSHVFARVHPGLDVPLNALLWTAAWVPVFGCIFLGSSSTFNAITSATVVALGVTYAIPPTINVLQGSQDAAREPVFQAARATRLDPEPGESRKFPASEVSAVAVLCLQPSPGGHRVVSRDDGALPSPSRAPRDAEQHELLHRRVWRDPPDCGSDVDI
ncbi:Choline transport protein [Tolypocladium paradoxum]|uniref:Choline transport protein n=1 Tax=Tolypocladium paradoxum TaxID=94208 RepID=A0A2S4L810_9HYPO|nr:Choline transport protein [Tolypocladium paradoxum]